MRHGRLIRLCLFALLLATAAPAAGRQETIEYDRDHPAAGFWVGELVTSKGASYTVLTIEHSGTAWTALATVPDFAMVGASAADLSVSGRAVSFGAAAPLGRMEIEAEVSEDGQLLVGTASVRRSGDPVECRVELLRTPSVRDLPGARAYSGEVDVSGMMQLGMSLVLAETPGGRTMLFLDVPMQMTFGLPLADVTTDGSSVTAALPGLAPATFDLVVGEERVTGTMRQAGMSLDIDFARDRGYTPPGMNRPQHPQPPYPYVVESIEVGHPDGHVLAGTLTRPQGPGPFPAAVLISGSGPQDRDETIFGHKPFLVIADHLTRAGIAVLRFDDRGIGASTGVFAGATSADFAGDVRALVGHLATLDAIDAERVGLIGHSEGGLIAPMVAADFPDEIAFVVLLAGPGVSGEEILKVQGRLILEAGGAAPEAVEAYAAQQEAMLRLVREGASDDELREAVEPLLAAELSEADGADGEVVDLVVRQQVSQLSSPWMRYFLTYDPAPALRRVRCPVLACNGTLDLQVWHEQNLDEIERVVTEAGGDVTIRRYEGLNHLFQPAQTGGLGEYGTIETTVDERLLEDVARWIRARMIKPTEQTE